MSKLYTVSIAIILSLNFISYSSAAIDDDGDKKSENQEVNEKQNIIIKEAKIRIGSRVVASVGGEQVEATVVNKVGKKKYFIRAYGDSNRIGFINEKKLSLKR